MTRLFAAFEDNGDVMRWLGDALSRSVKTDEAFLMRAIRPLNLGSCRLQWLLTMLLARCLRYEGNGTELWRKSLLSARETEPCANADYSPTSKVSVLAR